MQKIIKPWGFEYNFKSHKAQCSFPSYTSIPLRNVIWKIQSKTPTAALTNNVSTDWPHQRERVGQNQTNPTFHSTFPSHKITFYKTHFSPSKLNYSIIAMWHTESIYTLLFMYFACFHSAAVVSQKQASRSSLQFHIHWSHEFLPGSATHQRQNWEVPQVLKEIMASTFSPDLQELQLQKKWETIFFSVSCKLKLSWDEDCFLQIVGLIWVVHFWSWAFFPHLYLLNRIILAQIQH